MAEIQCFNNKKGFKVANVAEHYENHLADYYSWLFGGIKAKTEENRTFFKSHSIIPRGSGIAVDLGCGSGFQSIPLAKIGFDVSAIDLSKKLLCELNDNSRGLAIKTIKDDVLNFQNHLTQKVELAICMGDTITHIDSKEKIKNLFHNLFEALENNGRFILTFRDLMCELTGLDRFILVESDDSRIFTCFLEYEKETVKVHDIIYERTESGWNLKKSFYRKTRIPFDWAKKELEKSGFVIEFSNNDKGLITIIAKR